MGRNCETENSVYLVWSYSWFSWPSCFPWRNLRLITLRAQSKIQYLMGHSIALFIRTPSPPATSVCPTDYYNLLIPFIFFHLERLLHSDVFPSIDVGTLYIRRRNQLLRENAKKEVLLFYCFYSFIVYFYSTSIIFSSLMMLSICKSLDLNFNFFNSTLRLH